MDSTLGGCSDFVIGQFVQGVNAQLWRSNALMVANVVLLVLMVVVGASGRRYRHAAVTRFLFLGASTLYLPILSYVVSSIGKEYCNTLGMDVTCSSSSYVGLLLIWTALVQIVGTNTSAIVAVDDGDGQKLGPSIELLSRTVWTSYLVYYYFGRGFSTKPSVLVVHVYYYPLLAEFLYALCVLSLAKIMLKFYSFERARRSFALGRNSRLVAGYMGQLKGDSHRAPEDELIPPLIVMGEEKQEIEERPHGYSIKRRKNSLVTIDRVWGMVSRDILLGSRPCLKDLCLSFALFKLLRRRFAKCQLAESGSTKAFKFVQDVLLDNGNPDRVFRVVADEVSFVFDSYYSSLPTSYFGRLLPILNIIVSLSIITCCLVAGAIIAVHFIIGGPLYQILCEASCFPVLLFGNIFFNSIPTFSLLVATILAEALEIVSYLCSNWFKVTLLCSYVTRVTWQQSPLVQKCLGLVLKFRIKFIKSRDDQMGQITLLSHPHPKIYGLSRLFFCFSDLRVQHVKVPTEVKASIVGALRSSNGSLSKGTVALRDSRIGNNVLWACEGQGTSDVILVWHLATGIFEARHVASTGCSSDKKTAATYLSRYCVYLLAAAPELLPDDDAWSKKLYKTIRKGMDRVLTGSGGGKSVEYDHMIALLRETSEHEVVKRGVKLGEQLVELIPEEETGWGVLAMFWSEMILYVAPSDNVKAHKKAIARGGELLTLIWALLMHAGIVARPNIRDAV